MGSARDLESTIASSLRRQAEALEDLRLRCAQLRDVPDRSHAQLDAVTAAIDEQIDECIRIGELVIEGKPCARWATAAATLERQIRRLAVLRAKTLAHYVASAKPVRRR
jgi:hypothetical protein